MPYISHEDLNELREIARIATMANSCFTPFQCKRGGEHSAECSALREKTRLWRGGYIVEPLADIYSRIVVKENKLRACPSCDKDFRGSLLQHISLAHVYDPEAMLPRTAAAPPAPIAGA